LRTTPLLHAFPPQIRQRGARYHEEGRVTLTHREPELIFAAVRGTRTYGVAIEWVGLGEVRMSCDCPYARDHGVCKHLYAVLLAADAHSNGEVPAPAPPSPPLPPPPPPPEWRRRLAEARRHLALARDEGQGEAGGATGRRERLDAPLQYRFLIDHLRSTGEVLVDVVPPQGTYLTAEGWLGSRDPGDRAVARSLLGAESSGPFRGDYGRPVSRRYAIPPALYGSALRRIARTGRCTFQAGPGDPLSGRTIGWDDGGAWEVRLAIEPAAEGDPAGFCRLVGWFARGDERRAVEDATLVTAHGLLVAADTLARVKMGQSWPLVLALRVGGPIAAPEEALFELAAETALLPGAPEIALPEGGGFEVVRPEPRPRLTLDHAEPGRPGTLLHARLSFDYDGVVVDVARKVPGVVDPARRRIVYRTRDRERAARARLEELGVTRRSDWRSNHRPRLTLPARDLGVVVQALVGEGWEVEAHGRLQRPSTGTSASVRSGIDWFDLEGWVDFGDQRAPLPAALAALARGERVVKLGDGSDGMLPREWLERYAKVAELAAAAEDEAGTPVIRFRRGQAALLDALLAEQPGVEVDRTFARIRRELASFDRVRPASVPRGFQGELRGYQKEGLGWLAFLRRLGLGGCLADDMGLGKTVQVLALLERRRQEGEGPSLVVVPKSLVLNWMNEAKRFAPQLRVRNYTGPDRRVEPLDSGEFDLLVSTYGTLRRDAPELSAVAFDYVVLDEAQAIKNAGSATAKAARLLRGRHRLALSGTPIENHLGELWSLFEFLNPGMLGSAGAFRAFRSGERGLPEDLETRAVLARALRPFLLRRTKEEVAPELPARTEQTVLVELEGEQRKIYDGLREHYRAELLGKVDTLGLRRSKMHVLEALLRLRQAACHPGLLGPAHRKVAGAKLPLLVETLEEVVAEGHRALVFSQFTSFLALVRERLDRAGIPYEYLDGRTPDRQDRVDRFQEGGAPVFLISLRAGGYGLNLTAADYVFLLDPWWNPAVEAQAIDRTHRIGQTKPVVAMRFIARDTVEEKVLELQQTKRELADAILGENQGLLSRITREDLELLLA
jgi:superfamily II DNA or RNA helicase